jgi:NAD(P)-dependent dehydrogenase (short-subunit alcohol dehydrogenase family)
MANPPSKRVVVTGSNGGIGGAICKRLAQDGWSPIGIDIQPKGSGDWPYSSCDLADPASIARVFAGLFQDHGAIESLVNCAGWFHGRHFLDISLADFDQTFAVNIRAPFLTSQIVARHLIETKRPGTIVNIASISGRVSSPIADYGATKAGLINLTKSVAKLLGPHGIRVNAVAPGMVDTPMAGNLDAERAAELTNAIPLKRKAAPSEMADVVAFLVGDHSSYLTGAIIDANGGLF